MNGGAIELYKGAVMYEQILAPMDGKASARPSRDSAATKIGFRLYMVFLISWFLHLPARLPFLGTIRFDLLLIASMAVAAFLSGAETTVESRKIEKWLRLLIAYSIVVIPLVEWPGSVIQYGIPDLIKAVAFYYFTIAFVKSEKDLKQFISVFVLCQLSRILEPLYLHLTAGYFGDKAYQAGGDFLSRLSGAPHDVVNPNGLAFVVCTVLPFLYFLGRLSWMRRMAFFGVAPLCVYALTLTGSRSGLVGLGVVLLTIFLKSKVRTRVFFVAAGALAVVVGFSALSSDMKDRYLSLVGMGQKNEATVELRITGIQKDMDVVLRRPLFGYGLGTSREANYNFGWHDQPSHNIYVETAEELGIFGLAIFAGFMAAIFSGYRRLGARLRETAASPLVVNTVHALHAWLAMVFVFSFASYGLTGYDWYLLAGLLIAVQRQIQVSAPVRDGIGKRVQTASPERDRRSAHAPPQIPGPALMRPGHSSE
jgi:putative inorganic carbon (HCO3(-)) transporter